MRKTTIYLDDNEYRSLRNRAFIEEVSVAELLRRGARLVCGQGSPDEQKAMLALDRIRKRVDSGKLSQEDLDKEILNAQRDVRKKKAKKMPGGVPSAVR